MITAHQACAAQIEISQIQFRTDGLLGWLEYQPSAGRVFLCVERGDDVQVVTDECYSVHSRVHEYGGRSWCFARQGAYFVNGADQQIYFTSFEGVTQPKQLTDFPASRFVEPIWHGPSGSLIAIEELHGGSVENRLVSIDGDTGELTLLHDACEFYAGLALSPNEDQLAWVSWQHPNMPWQTTELWHCACGPDGWQMPVLGLNETLEESLVQARYDHQGRLHVVSDREGYWNVYRVVEGDLQPLQQSCHDMISAPWQGGLVQYALSEPGELWHLRFASEAIRLYCNHKPVALGDYNHVRELGCHGGRIALVVASALQTTSLAIWDSVAGQLRIVRQGSCPIEPAQVSKPSTLTFTCDNTSVDAYYYAPAAGGCVPPVIINIHGGPTSSTYPIFNAAVQYWTQRGFAYVDLNYRGSSNRGRAFRNALHGQWGRVEVEDVAALVEHLLQLNMARTDGLFVRGRSSGGYSVLMALRALPELAGGVSYFGVSDPRSLQQSTHKFESNYLPWLLGSLDEDYLASAGLCPAVDIERIRAPVLFFQGEQDRVVTPDQTRNMVEALKAAGRDVVACYFVDEGHGFRQLANQVDALLREEAFYRRVLGRPRDCTELHAR